MGNINNSTAIDHIHIYHRLGVRPPHNTTRVLQLFGLQLPLSRWSWRIHGRILPLLHLFDGNRHKDRPPPDVFVNLRVLWCKLLTSLDPNSLAYEGQQRRRKRGHSNNSNAVADTANQQEQQQLFATYRMLPPYSMKWTLRYLGLWRFFPRWMHANIELRTVYLNRALTKVLKLNMPSAENNATSTISGIAENVDKCAVDKGAVDTDNICVIILGGGYDPRGAKLSCCSPTTSNIRRVYELDLPVVVDSKRRLLRRAGFRVIDDDDNKDIVDSGFDRDRDRDRDNGVRLEGIDLNDDVAVDQVLDKIQQELISLSKLSEDNNSDDSNSKNCSSTTRRNRWRVVVISEAVLMYLKPGKADRILEGLSERFGEDGPNNFYNASASFVFADRLFRHNATANITSSENSVHDASTAADTAAKNVATAEGFTGMEESDVRQWLRDRGWKLQEFLSKPGATRHLGIATTT